MSDSNHEEGGTTLKLFLHVKEFVKELLAGSFFMMPLMIFGILGLMFGFLKFDGKDRL
jgi:hypothetical protein